jgi:hypothetical protein
MAEEGCHIRSAGDAKAKGVRRGMAEEGSRTVCGRGKGKGRLTARDGGRRGHIPSAGDAKAKGVSGEGWRRKAITYHERVGRQNDVPILLFLFIAKPFQTPPSQCSDQLLSPFVPLSFSSRLIPGRAV